MDPESDTSLLEPSFEKVGQPSSCKSFKQKRFTPEKRVRVQSYEKIEEMDDELDVENCQAEIDSVKFFNDGVDSITTDDNADEEISSEVSTTIDETEHIAEPASPLKPDQEVTFKTLPLSPSEKEFGFRPPTPMQETIKTENGDETEISRHVTWGEEVPNLQKRWTLPDICVKGMNTNGTSRWKYEKKKRNTFSWLKSLQKDLTIKELAKKYQLHAFVALIFLITVLSVSLAWHYKNKAKNSLYSSQAIFFDPRTRILTLIGHVPNARSITVEVGLDMPRWQLPLHCPIVMDGNPHYKECVWKNNAILRISQFTSTSSSLPSSIKKSPMPSSPSFSSFAPQRSDPGVGGGADLPSIDKSGGDSSDTVLKYSPRVGLEDDGEVFCYKVSWESLHPEHVPHDCFDISDDLWYGPSNQSKSVYPIRGSFYFNPTNYTIGNNGIFSKSVDFYWLTAKGVALYIDADDPVHVFWNISGTNKLCVLSNYTGPFYHQINHMTAPHLNYTLCSGPDALRTHSFMLSRMDREQRHKSPSREAQGLPNIELLKGSFWSIKNYVGQESKVNQSHVTQLAEMLNASNFENTKIVIDADWQTNHGDLAFDSQRFFNVTRMSSNLDVLGSSLIVEVSPYFSFSSQNFQQGVHYNKFVQDSGGQVTGLANSDFGLTAVIDVSVPEGRKWYADKLVNISRDFDTSATFAGLRLTYGKGSWLPYKPHFRQGEESTPNSFRRQMTETVRGLTSEGTLVAEHTSDSRHSLSFIPVTTMVEVRGETKCLTGLIETALTLGLMGYPYILADGLSVVSEGNVEETKVSRELFIRWLEMATLFPAHQHTIMPWLFDEEDPKDTVSLAANITHENEELRMVFMRDSGLQRDITLGLPIIRPVWWTESTNQTAHALEISDEFLLGSKLLVAPVLCEGVSNRNIHIPRGVWQDHHSSSQYFIGPTTLENFETPLGKVAAFKKVADADILAYKNGADL